MTPYARFILNFVRYVALVVFALVILMGAASMADCSLHLNWGWDCSTGSSVVLIALAALVIFVVVTIAQRAIAKWTYPK
jgi:uncharacterized membrane protein